MRTAALLTAGLLALCACSRPAPPPAPAPAPVAAPAPEPPPAKKAQMICRSSVDGRPIKCGEPNAVMVGIKSD